MATEHQVVHLVAAFVTALQPDVVVEVGAYEGDTSRAIGGALARNGWGHLHTVEVDPARAETARVNTVGLPVTVHTIDVTEWTPPPFVDFAWVDGASRYRERDARIVMQACRPGAVLGFHDTAQGMVRRQLQQLGLRYLFLPTLRGVAFARLP